MDFFNNPTEKVIYTIIVELYEIKHFVYTLYRQKIGTNFSKLGANGQLMINSTEVIFVGVL